jgi:hypothetical protein
MCNDCGVGRHFTGNKNIAYTGAFEMQGKVGDGALYLLDQTIDGGKIVWKISTG